VRKEVVGVLKNGKLSRSSGSSPLILGAFLPPKSVFGDFHNKKIFFCAEYPLKKKRFHVII